MSQARVSKKADPLSVAHFPTSHWKVDHCTPGDVGFIIDSWASDQSVHVARPRGYDPDVFKVGQRERILRLISACNCVCIRPSDEYWRESGREPNPNELFGWICFSMDRKTLRPTIHFVYVKAPYREKGLASCLLKIAGVRPEKASWMTHERFWLRKPAYARGLVFNDFLLDHDPAAPAQKWKYP